MEYLITPVPKPRMTQRDKWLKRPCVLEYWRFRDQCRSRRLKLPCEGAHITFILPMPGSWSQKKKIEMEGKKHESNPDVDNLLKGLADAVYKNDSCIWDIRITKIWGYEGKIVITQNQTTIKHLEEFELMEREGRIIKAMLKVVTEKGKR